MDAVKRLVLLGFTGLLLACGPDGESGEASAGPRSGPAPLTLGPKDGFDLPPTEPERVAVGTVAPDFSLPTLDGDTITLSEFRGSKDVILVFYRGYW